MNPATYGRQRPAVPGADNTKVMERDRDQADLPTEQSPSGQDPRLPAADAHPRGPRDPRQPSWEGPQGTVGLTVGCFPAGTHYMLPTAHRMRSGLDFSSVTRQGRRTRCGGLVVYLLDSSTGGEGAASVPARVGLIVGKSVGISVVRHSVARRLRAQLAARLDRLPAGSRLVVRALPASATAESPAIGRDLDKALARLTGMQQ